MDEKTTPFISNAAKNGQERKKAASTPPPVASKSKHLANAREQLADNQPVGSQQARIILTVDEPRLWSMIEKYCSEF